jgi:hypothetical protein
VGYLANNSACNSPDFGMDLQIFPRILPILLPAQACARASEARNVNIRSAAASFASHVHITKQGTPKHQGGVSKFVEH